MRPPLFHPTSDRSGTTTAATPIATGVTSLPPAPKSLRGVLLLSAVLLALAGLTFSARSMTSSLAVPSGGSAGNRRTLPNGDDHHDDVAMAGSSKPPRVGDGDSHSAVATPLRVERKQRLPSSAVLSTESSSILLGVANLRTPFTESSSHGKPKVSAIRPSRKSGRDLDLSVMGLSADPESGINHAWGISNKSACHGLRANGSCVPPTVMPWLRRHALLAIITGSEGSFRVDVSDCTWLVHVPKETVSVFTDVLPSASRWASKRWVAGLLPVGVWERDGDVFSAYVKKGYLNAVRRAGQGYSVSWIVAQFRFLQAVDDLMRQAGYPPREDAFQRGAAHPTGPTLRPANTATDWVVLGDDDTVFHATGLVARLQALDPERPFYLSQQGWGGAGHIFSRGALKRLQPVLAQCIDRWMVRQFRASDAMMVKCAELAKLERVKDVTMSHCPASNVREAGLLQPSRVSLHAKKDFYPPVLLATWRLGLYYQALYCRDEVAARWATWFSGCAFGSCKFPGCEKAHDLERQRHWNDLAANVTRVAHMGDGVLRLPWAQYTKMVVTAA